MEQRSTHGNHETPLVTFALVGDPQYANRDGVANRNFRAAKGLLQRLIQRYLQTEQLDFIVSLGDLGDGQSRSEIPEMMQCYQESQLPVRYVVGNHDLVLYSEEELRQCWHLDGLFYEFTVGEVCFLVLNGLDESRFSPPGSERFARAAQYRLEHSARLLRDWDGKLSDTSREWLTAHLKAAERAGRDVVIFNHVPIFCDASGENAVMWDSAELLEILDRFGNIRACFAGHYHPGAIALRKGVLHKTVRAICNSNEPTGVIVRLYKDRLELEGVGEEHSFCHNRKLTPSYLAGTAPAGAWVMTNSGEITQTAPDGSFRLKVPAPGCYCCKAVADGCQDAYLPMIHAPADDLRIEMTSDLSRRVVTGDLGEAAALKITDDGEVVRWFDLAGTAFGGLEPPPPGWHERAADRFWTSGRYAFSAKGVVSMVRAPHHRELRARGWFKGDFHAHLIHGENFYRGNLIESAFLARAEGFDWLWLAGDFANDSEITDYPALANVLSGPDFLLKLNYEFPKTLYGHVGNVGTELLQFPYDCEKATDFEMAKRYIYDRGGAAVPVHLLYNDGIRKEEDGREFSWMTFKETFLWLLCAPEMCGCFDLFYNDDTPGAEEFYFMLLNRGYRIGCCATSDAAFDVGRAPGGDRGTTFAALPELTEKSVAAALRQGRTIVSWDGAVVLPEISGHGPGSVLPADGEAHTLTLDLFDRPEVEVEYRIVRNGDLWRIGKIRLPETGHWSMVLEESLRETENCWYLASCRAVDAPERIRSISSPVYFRRADFHEPERLPFPVPFPETLRKRLKYLTIAELTSETVFDEIRNEILQASEAIDSDNSGDDFRRCSANVLRS
ncbi:MAG: CehA/McbA family metallohydrolase [Victivallaceae bacterium]|nr:CehA/McbA family metallohydrolase [Victivallaceae bacterium]